MPSLTAAAHEGSELSGTGVAVGAIVSEERVADMRPASSRWGELLAVLAVLAAVASVGAFVVV